MTNPFAPLNDTGGAAGNGAAPPAGGAGKRGRPAYRAIVPVPASAPPPPEDHPKLGKPTHRWRYHDADGALLTIIDRFDEAGGKIFLPLVFAAPEAGGAPAWRRQALPTPRPLYRLDELARRAEAPVLLCEGEKAADAAAQLFPGHIVMTSPGGAKAAAAADWSPLAGRRVVIWPDSDVPGRDYATDAATRILAAGAASVAVVPVQADFPDGWDLADALPPGVEPDGLRALLEAAEPFGEAEGEAGGGRKRGRTPQRDLLLADLADVELWHDETGEAFATLPVNGHFENHPVNSPATRRWTGWRWFEEHKTVLGATAMEDFLRICDARAVAEGKQYKPFMRVGQKDGSLYYDTGNARWSCWEITAHECREIDLPPVKFLRSRSMLEAPAPVFGAASAMAALRETLPVPAEDFVMFAAWLVACLRPTGPYPILCVGGEQGSGKSVLSRLIRSIIDPSIAPIRAMPKDERDLAVAAYNSHILAFDNVSSFSSSQSDSLCRVATGSGFGYRRLHTDRDENLVEVARAIIINGISDVFGRADLADRSISVYLAAIPEKGRRTERQILAEFEARRGEILGGLLEAASVALRRMPDIRLDGAPRMADFVEWSLAAAPALDVKPEEFLEIYKRNRKSVADASFENDPLAVAILAYIQTLHPNGVEMEPAILYAALGGWVSDETRRAPSWPKSSAGFGSKLRRIAPLLRGKGLAVDFGKSGNRRVRIAPAGEGA